MIHTMFSISALAFMFNMIAYADQTLQQEVITAEDDHELIIMVNDKARDLCKKTVECWHKAGLEYNDAALDELLDPQVALVDYATLLGGLKSCLNEQWAPTTQEELALKDAVQKEHDLMQQEYEDLVAQMGTRRIKIKYYAKVIAGELVVGNTATINRLIVNNCIQLPSLPAGLLQVTDGCLTTTIIPSFEIIPGSITTADLADGAVTTAKIADAPLGVTGAKINTGTILTTNLSFNPLRTNTGITTPFTVYRGLIATDGTITAGTGFTSGGTPANGTYTITLTGTPAYTSTTSYSVVVQPGYVGPNTGFYSITQTSSTVFTIQFFATDGTTLVQPLVPFSFYTIGN